MTPDQDKAAAASDVFAGLTTPELAQLVLMDDLGCGFSDALLPKIEPLLDNPQSTHLPLRVGAALAKEFGRRTDGKTPSGP